MSISKCDECLGEKQNEEGRQQNSRERLLQILNKVLLEGLRVGIQEGERKGTCLLGAEAAKVERDDTGLGPRAASAAAFYDSLHHAPASREAKRDIWSDSRWREKLVAK